MSLTESWEVENYRRLMRDARELGSRIDWETLQTRVMRRKRQLRGAAFGENDPLLPDIPDSLQGKEQ